MPHVALIGNKSKLVGFCLGLLDTSDKMVTLCLVEPREATEF